MLIIDRIEERKAVCETEDGGHITLDRFPEGAREGDVLVPDESGEYRIDSEETERRRALAVRLSALIRGRRR